MNQSICHKSVHLTAGAQLCVTGKRHNGHTQTPKAKALTLQGSLLRLAGAGFLIHPLFGGAFGAAHQNPDRPVTVDILRRLDLRKAAVELGLTKELDQRTRANSDVSANVGIGTLWPDL